MHMYKNSETEKKIDELMSKMTLSEKIGQLQQIGPSPVGGFEISDEDALAMFRAGKITGEAYESIISHTMLDKREDNIRRGEVGSFIGIDDAELSNHLQRIAVEESRLGIPLIMGMDVIHGHKTIFPIPLAQACSFDEKTFEQSAAVAAREASEDGIHWTYAPMADICRDARWGRMCEGFGEDTFLASRCSAAMVRGFQGDDISRPDRIAACVKHFAAYGACEGGRDYDTVDMSLPKFYETYLPPYAAAVKAGAATVMAAFNDLNGVPCTANRWLLKTLLREELGFDGFVISDAHAIEECVNHGTAQNLREAVKQSIEAGCDMDLGSDAYIELLGDMIKSGEVSESDLDNSVRAVLRIKFSLGLFERPYVERGGVSSKLSAEHRAAALNISRKSAVLLKNDGALLPLSKKAKIAVVGAVAAERDEVIGAWCCSDIKGSAVSLIDALDAKGIEYVYSPCVSEYGPLDREMLAETVKDAEVIIAALAYKASGEAMSMADIELSASQIKMLKELSGTGKPVIGVLFNGRPVALGAVVPKVSALLEAWHLGTESGNAVADILFGDFNPTGRLSATVPYVSSQLPLYYNHPNTGRPADDDVGWSSKYTDVPVKPLYPFGYGLSYTDYSYRNITARPENDILYVSVDVKNTGKTAGTETVQLYIHRHKASRVRPVRELKGYKKVFLLPGEEKTVTIGLQRKELGYYDVSMKYNTDISEFDVWMAHDSSCGEHMTVIF